MPVAECGQWWGLITSLLSGPDMFWALGLPCTPHCSSLTSCRALVFFTVTQSLSVWVKGGPRDPDKRPGPNCVPQSAPELCETGEPCDPSQDGSGMDEKESHCCGTVCSCVVKDVPLSGGSCCEINSNEILHTAGSCWCCPTGSEISTPSSSLSVRVPQSHRPNTMKHTFTF